MKLLFINIFILLSSLTIGQTTKVDTNKTTEKIIGKWVGQKSEQLSKDKKLEVYPYSDTLILNPDFSCKFFTGVKEIVTGQWVIDSSKSIEQKFILNHDNVTDVWTIYKLTKDSLVLRFFECSTKNDIDFYFYKSK